MKKRIFIAIALSLGCAAAITAAGCKHDILEGLINVTEKHTEHTYDMRIAETQFMKSYATCQARAVYYYSCECGARGNDTFEFGELGNHDYSGEYIVDQPNGCAYEGTRYKVCKACHTESEKEKIPAGNHDLEHHERKDATCTEAGWEAYDSCKNCSYNTKVNLPIMAHTFEKDWSYDETYHWHASKCGHRDREVKEKHLFSGDVCAYCGYERATTNQKFTFERNKTGDGYILTGLGEGKAAVFTVPDSYVGLPVKEIGDGAFRNCTWIEEIILPDSIEKIARGAFYQCSSLRKLSIGKNVVDIDDNAFGTIDALQEIVVDGRNPVYYVKNNCLINRQTETLVKAVGAVTIPDDGSVTKLGNASLRITKR